jgi:hypothetical protein
LERRVRQAHAVSQCKFITQAGGRYVESLRLQRADT